MSETDRDDEGRGQQPGADVGDDHDVPADPLLPAPAEDEPAEVAEPAEPAQQREDGEEDA